MTDCPYEPIKFIRATASADIRIKTGVSNTVVSKPVWKITIASCRIFIALPPCLKYPQKQRADQKFR